jgi:uncharacterized protein
MSMRVWIDLANSPHVATFEPVVERLRAEGETVELTARDHAQTVELARRAFGAVRVVGGESPSGRVRKGLAVADRAHSLWRLARELRLDVALSHGSYAQLMAARLAGIPGVTMMDYEFQPANHVSFRLARRVVVPAIFPEWALRRFGAREGKVVRYDGFKEELYIARFDRSESALAALGVDPTRVVVVMRPPPEGALYHRFGNVRFEEVFETAASRDDVQIVVLPRSREQAARYGANEDAVVPDRPVDGRLLLAEADLMVGAGGTMNREAALMGTPTFTLFAGRLAAVDAELIRLGLLHDLRQTGAVPFVKKVERDRNRREHSSEQILGRIRQALDEAVQDR